MPTTTSSATMENGFMSSRTVLANLPISENPSELNILKRKSDETTSEPNKFAKTIRKSFIDPNDLIPQSELESFSKARSSITGGDTQFADMACVEAARGVLPEEDFMEWADEKKGKTTKKGTKTSAKKSTSRGRSYSGSYSRTSAWRQPRGVYYRRSRF
jgi:hypothetical protein